MSQSKGKTENTASKSKLSREERLAQRLRDNLRRRKAAARKVKSE